MKQGASALVATSPAVERLLGNPLIMLCQAATLRGDPFVRQTIDVSVIENGVAEDG